MSNGNSETKSEFYPPYSEFSKTLRTWFVAYGGIGVPVVLLANVTHGQRLFLQGAVGQLERCS
jgi:hypothetical protein